MRLLLGLAAVAAAAVPTTSAGAQTWASQGFSTSGGLTAVGRVQVHRDGDWRRDHRRHDRRDRTVVVGDLGYYGGEWALHNNRSWNSDSYNDWWHDRPDRSYPRWMSSNQDCQRRYWSGGGWRC